MFSRAWLKDTVERALATAAEAVLALLTADGLEFLEVDWAEVAGVGGLAAIAAVLKAVIASRTNSPNSASLVDLPGKHAAPEA